MNQPMRELPQYKSHKIVHALKIRNIDVDLNSGAAVITPEEDGYGPFGVDAEYMGKHKPRIGGYYVVYEDGYKSWSPADAFEKGYTKIDGRDDVAPCAIHWQDLAKSLATVWWEVSKIGGSLQHGDLENAGTMFSVVLEQHGGHCFHGETPMDAWRKAHAWLVSPERPSLSWPAQCDTALTKLQSVIDSSTPRTYEQKAEVSNRLNTMALQVATQPLQPVK